MKKRTKSLLAAFCTMALCGCLIAGSTYALFTDTANVDISVTSGKVDVDAMVSLLSCGSLNAATTYTNSENKLAALVNGSEKELTSDDYYTFDGDDAKFNGYYVKETKDISDDNDEVTFTNGGTASLAGNKLTLDKITPGDSVNLSIGITNNSNVSVYYRIKFYCDNEYKADDKEDKTTLTDFALFDSLDITIPVGYSQANSKVLTYTKKSLSGVKSYTTSWMQLAANESTNISSDGVTVSLPITIGNEVQNRTCDIYYVVEAVQYNANIGINQIEEVYIDQTKSGAGKVQEVAIDSNSQATETTVEVLDALTKNNQSSEEQTTEKSSVTVKLPAAALQKTITNADNQTTTTAAQSVQVNVTSTTVADVNKKYAAVSVETGNSAYAIDVDASVDGVTAPTLTDDSTYEISFEVGTVELDNVYHKGTVLKEGVENKNEDGEYYKYEDGTITLYVKSFSPFVISYLFGGGLGTADYPFLIYTAEQFNGLASLTSIITEKFGIDNDAVNFKLMSDISLGKTLSIDNTLNLDLNGYTIDNGVTLTSLIEVASGVLTINDSKTGNTGSIINTSAVTYYAISAILVNNNANLVIDNGVISSTYEAVYVYRGTVNIKGGSIYGTYYGIYSKMGTVNVNGGSVTGNKDYAIYATYGYVSNNLVYPYVYIYGGSITSNSESNSQCIGVNGYIVYYGGIFNKAVDIGWVDGSCRQVANADKSVFKIISGDETAEEGFSNYHLISTSSGLNNAIYYGGEVKLSSSITYTNSNKYLGKDMLIDLNGYTLTLDKTIYVYNGTEVIIKNGTIQEASTYDSAVLFIYMNATLTLDGVTVNAATSATIAAIQAGNPTKSAGHIILIGKSVINNSTGIGVGVFGYKAAEGATQYYSSIEVTDSTVSSYNQALTSNGSNDTGNEQGYVEIIVNSGVIESSNAMAIYAPAACSRTYIKGGTITGLSGIEVRAGTLVLTGGVITATADEFKSAANDNGVTTSGAAIVVVQHTTLQDIYVTIIDAELNGVYAIFEDDTQGNDGRKYNIINESGETVTNTYTAGNHAAAIHISIKGGTINGEVSSTCQSGFITGGTFSGNVESKYIADNYILVSKTEGTGEDETTIYKVISSTSELE
jgi:predicted ribosomally synthesized peptide with SipW-like signal peptide